WYPIVLVAPGRLVVRVATTVPLIEPWHWVALQVTPKFIAVFVANATDVAVHSAAPPPLASVQKVQLPPLVLLNAASWVFGVSSPLISELVMPTQLRTLAVEPPVFTRAKNSGSQSRLMSDPLRIHASSPFSLSVVIVRNGPSASSPLL